MVIIDTPVVFLPCQIACCENGTNHEFLQKLTTVLSLIAGKAWHETKLCHTGGTDLRKHFIPPVTIHIILIRHFPPSGFLLLPLNFTKFGIDINDW